MLVMCDVYHDITFYIDSKNGGQKIEIRLKHKSCHYNVKKVRGQEEPATKSSDIT